MKITFQICNILEGKVLHRKGWWWSETAVNGVRSLPEIFIRLHLPFEPSQPWENGIAVMRTGIFYWVAEWTLLVIFFQLRTDSTRRCIWSQNETNSLDSSSFPFNAPGSLSRLWETPTLVPNARGGSVGKVRISEVGNWIETEYDMEITRQGALKETTSCCRSWGTPTRRASRSIRLSLSFLIEIPLLNQLLSTIGRCLNEKSEHEIRRPNRIREWVVSEVAWWSYLSTLNVSSIVFSHLWLELREQVSRRCHSWDLYRRPRMSFETELVPCTKWLHSTVRLMFRGSTVKGMVSSEGEEFEYRIFPNIGCLSFQLFFPWFYWRWSGFSFQNCSWKSKIFEFVQRVFFTVRLVETVEAVGKVEKWIKLCSLTGTKPQGV